uniref:ATP synthase subunit a n=1 Tax=Calanus sinicus TaxID=114070 RepID=F1ADK8_CALSV|nr:ATP synthase F0 subunit 6 [Calanus sinicus]ADT63587.1 ATPase subunit 6 [Calanus sinicus]ADT63588.1 ATPase subunit 6 [Calanus sinicus]ADT63613.1 ATPase subunit 6 [Calanus sinicus]ADT63626.1 ATPase subunit 6 [Calanus sinicus]
MTGLFSSFDPTMSIFSIDMSLNWAAGLIVSLSLPQSYWLVNSQFSKGALNIMYSLKKELGAVLGVSELPGTSFMFINIFLFILFSNLMGLLPYIFTSTSHLSVTLVLALPLWLGSMMWSMVFQYNSLLAHLVPLGTPAVLMPVMVLIETVSSVIRPITLSIRLAANMVAGHLLLTLLGTQGPGLAGTALVSMILGLVLLLFLELAVACIQSYVFTILSSLYLGELMSTNFNMKNTK